MISTREPVSHRSISHAVVFLVVCAAAGALAVPVDAFVTPAAAAAVLLIAMLGLRVWTWSRLTTLARDGGWPVVWIAVGLAVGLVLLAVIRLVIEPMLPEIGTRIARAGTLPIWRRVIIIYVAAVTEELLFRLLLFSVVAGLMARLLRRTGKVPRSVDISVANAVSALVFAAVHLPAWINAGPLAAGVVASVLILNAAGGLVLGYVFARHGIVSAMWAHAGGDCAIQLLGPLTG
jgi:hypothetical protein